MKTLVKIIFRLLVIVVVLLGGFVALNRTLPMPHSARS